ncbi:hypothetical protein LCGC14_1514330 [marine sediment metagenome]|uniref:Guanylate cyclase domain-containing protein n=1 Tax=marine sediment metagenome TaxID=412755 RepID=A0A0F9JL76_9ZZZZ
MEAKKNVFFLIPIIAVIIFSLLGFLDFYKYAEYFVFDLMLRIKPGIPEHESILIIDIDDVAISEVGVWPWSRDVVADGLVLLREFGVNYVVFDIEYTEESPLGINSKVLFDDIPALVTEEFSEIERYANDLFMALATGNLALADAKEYIDDLSGLTQTSRDVVLERLNEIARDNDYYLGQAARLFGKAYFTVNMLPYEEDSVPEDLLSYVEANIPIKNIKLLADFPQRALGIRPAISPIIEGSKGAGFPNVIVDGDGVRRRIELITDFNGKYYPQLVFSALLDWLGQPEVQIVKDSIILKKAVIPGEGVKDIKIPVEDHNKVLINWSKNSFHDSFEHISFYELVLHKELERNLLHNLKSMEEAGYLTYYRGDSDLMEVYLHAEKIKEEIFSGGDPAMMEDYVEARDFFFQELGSYITGDTDEEILGDINRVLSSDGLNPETKQFYIEIKEQVPEFFDASTSLYENLMELRVKLKEKLGGSFSIIGHTGTSTTDIGVTPFEEEYMNLGIHASLVNTILTGRFLNELPKWYSILSAFILCLILTFIIKDQSPLMSVLIGFILLSISGTANAVFFIITGKYIELLTPLLSFFLTFAGLTLLNLLLTEKEKRFFRNAFSHYISPDIINDLIEHPDRLHLGGIKKHLTAFFTDIEGFSTISESLDPTELVALLNIYLSEMSNIILELKGTIDKYEGDGIISFFGAPVDFEDHARRACLAAVRIKEVESKLNERFMREKLSPSPLLTRIGINTGEMVVGNMGTSNKMNYTVMGNEVNLASRLEGVNKAYGTWILASEATKIEAGPDFIMRKIGRVRGVGILEPIPLYELVDEKTKASKETLEAVELFHEGLDQFNERSWKKAERLFRAVLQIHPTDGPARLFVKRCIQFQREPPPAKWDGVFVIKKK